VLENDAPLDTKNCKYQTFRNWDNVLPIYYQIQAQVQMMLLDSDYAEMACFIEGEKLVIFPVYKDASLQDRIVNETGEFALSILKAKQVQKHIDESKTQEDRELYTEVLQSLEPSLDYSDSQTELLYDMYGEPDGNIMKGSKVSDLWAKRYLKCNEVIALADKYKTFSKNQLLNYIKDANGCLTDSHKVLRVSKSLKPLFKVTLNK
jgi:predicted phage-related endonuclease